MKKHLVTLVLAGLLAVSALLVGACAEVTDLRFDTGLAVGSRYLITFDASATVPSDGPIRAVIALRAPAAWRVASVVLESSTATDGFRESSVIEKVFAEEWEAEPAGVGHNGHKDGYAWWVGYSPAQPWRLGQMGRVTITLDTRGRGGSYLLDLVTGVAGSTDPENPADKSLWQMGSVGLKPSGVWLDQPVTLHCFTDVSPHTQYYDAIQGMGGEGLIDGYPGGVDGHSGGTDGYREFRPENPVLRAQFAKMVVGALGLTVDERTAPPVEFRDLGRDDPANLYPHEYVWTAWANGIVKGYTNGDFKPYVSVSRAHAVTMTVRAVEKLYPGVLPPVPPDFMQTWGNDLLKEHCDNARTAQHGGLLVGLPLDTTARDGNGPMSRGEVAQVLRNMMNLIDGFRTD